MDFIRLLIRHYRLVGLTAFTFALVVGGTLFLLPPVYEASATLVIIPPKITSDLKPSSLTVQGYQKLLEADQVIEETRQRLIAQGILKPKDPFRLRDELETRIFVSRYSETIALAPMVQVVVRRNSAEHASIAANVWAEVFLQRIRELTVGSTSAQVKFVDEQYPKSQELLAKTELERLNSAFGFNRQLDELTRTWDEKVLRLKNETSELLTTYNVESRSLTEELMGATGLKNRQNQLKALQKAYFDLQLEQIRVASQQQSEKYQLEAARKYLVEVPPYLTLRKALTDDAIWRSLVTADGKEPDWKLLQEKSLLAQEVNPVHRDLSGRLAQLEVSEKALMPRAKQLEEELHRLSAGIKALDVSLRADELKLDRLERERESGLEKLQNKRVSDLSDLMRERQRYIASLTMERDLRLAQLDRGLAQEKELNLELAKNFNQALLAKAQQSSEDVRLGAAAVPPNRPLSRGAAVGAVLALFAGVIAGGAFISIRDSAGSRAA